MLVETSGESFWKRGRTLKEPRISGSKHLDSLVSLSLMVSEYAGRPIFFLTLAADCVLDQECRGSGVCLGN
jgi:hypothetical protein